MIKAKKSLGQNFLIDRDILEKITDIVPIKDKHVLEVGPGTGNLTSFILKKAPRKLIVVEKDNDLALNLEEKFVDKLTVINKDILEIDEAKLSNDKMTVFGNLPYNISTEILSKWITNINGIFWFDHLILMFQKEVADRIIAKFNTSNYGRLSILSNWKLKVEKICDIKPTSFTPRPKIDSSLLFFSLYLGLRVVCETETLKLSISDNIFTNVVLPAPDGEDKTIITPSFSEGI